MHMPLHELQVQGIIDLKDAEERCLVQT